MVYQLLAEGSMVCLLVLRRLLQASVRAPIRSRTLTLRLVGRGRWGIRRLGCPYTVPHCAARLPHWFGWHKFVALSATAFANDDIKTQPLLLAWVVVCWGTAAPSFHAPTHVARTHTGLERFQT